MNSAELVQNSIDTWNNADRQGFLACYADDCEIVTPAMRGKGHEGIAEFWAATMDTFPDNQVRVLTLVADGDIVAEEALTEGTNTGPSRAPDGSAIPPTGKSMTLPFTAIHTVHDDKIVSSRFYWDVLSILGQLGLLPE